MNSSSASLGRNLVSLKWEDFSVFVISELAALYQKDDMTDVTLYCEGRSFRAHRVLLSLWSIYFRDVFRSISHSHPVVILRETNSTDLELILRFIYQGHLLIPIEETDRFLKTAEHFQIAGLKNMRHHVPNLSYASTGSNTAFQDHTEVRLPHHGQNTVYEEPRSAGGSTGSHSSIPSQISKPTQANTSFLSGAPLTSERPPTPVDSRPPTQFPVHQVGEGSNHQHVLRQSSSRPCKQIISSPHQSGSGVGYQDQANIASSQNSSVQNPVGVRLTSDSVIYQSHPVLIFQNGSATSSCVKSGEQYITTLRSGGENRGEHSMMVLESVVGNSSVGHSQSHIEPPASTSSGCIHVSNSVSTNGLYSNFSSAVKPVVVHSSAAASESEILGLPYHTPQMHRDHRDTCAQPPESSEQEVVSDSEDGHTPIAVHSHSRRGSDAHLSSIRETESDSQLSISNSNLLPIPLTASNSHAMEIGNDYDSGGSGMSQTFSKLKASNPATGVGGNGNGSAHSTPVYAVKRLPPPLPPLSHSPTTSSCSEPSTSGITKTPIKVSPKMSPSSAGQLDNSERLSIRTRSSASTKVSEVAKGPDVTQKSDVQRDIKEFSGISSNRKVVLVPCPKCGKRVKQTSLKVHMKRTHLEEGTVLVCPICSKRISSKGVYYKHMYIHRKRSESAGRIMSVKTEPQRP